MPRRHSSIAKSLRNVPSVLRSELVKDVLDEVPLVFVVKVDDVLVNDVIVAHRRGLLLWRQGQWRRPYPDLVRSAVELLDGLGLSQSGCGIDRLEDWQRRSPDEGRRGGDGRDPGWRRRKIRLLRRAGSRKKFRVISREIYQSPEPYNVDNGPSVVRRTRIKSSMVCVCVCRDVR